MNKRTYIVATIREWNISAFKDVISKYPGTWHLITDKKELTIKRIKQIKPRYIFFPHWSFKVPNVITEFSECVCFHETEVPFGRGGSPIQNLIMRGYEKTKISALKMTKKLDAGPVYLRRDLGLDGLAEEIFIRSSKIIAGMIKEIIHKEPLPKAQKGEIVVFKRRTPEQSVMTKKLKSLDEVFDFLRMLDVAEYPRAFFERDGLRYEFSRPALRTSAIEADVRITKCKNRSKK
ncbi:MAG: methionyl-tRNA formyltransferase [PVC group bacterium]|nr:methionyl-tRNA formyltransferase [PVC group bacterium]